MQALIDKIHSWEKVYLVRKSKWLFFVIILKILLFLFLTLGALYILNIINTKTNDEFLQLEIISMYAVLLVSYVSIISAIVTYFYNVIIITNKWIYKIKLWLFFNEEIDIIDLYKVQEIKSQTKWFFQVFLNVWELHLVEQKDTEKIIHFIDSPEEVARIIKWVQHKLVETRYNK